MEYVMLGRTGLRVSVAGLGCGGFSLLGLGTGKSNAEAVALLRQALDMGVNLLDTAAAYGTEAIVGEAIFPLTRRHRVGTLLMFAVRNIFSRPGQLVATLQQLAAEGEVPRWLAESDDPLGFLIYEGGAKSVIDAAYRFARYEPGVDVVLFGTGDPEHLRTNIASLLAPPLPEADRARLASLFGHLVGVGLDAPHLARSAAARRP